MKKDIDDVNMAITKVEQEKTNRDHTIRSLNDEIASQDEIINKLNKEKKHIGDNAAKSSEDLAVADEKVNHLSQIKKKLESTLDELESSLEKEKRARTTVEKDRSKKKKELKHFEIISNSQEEDRGRAEGDPGVCGGSGESKEGVRSNDPAEGEGRRRPHGQAGRRAVLGVQGAEEHQGGTSTC